ncbi:MAG: DUF4124 domain-containing protein [Candidatus Competibacteraceae bacterium]
MNRKPLVLSLSTVILLALPTTVPAQQQVYKWTDASGRVHYGEKAGKRGTGADPRHPAAIASEPSRRR